MIICFSLPPLGTVYLPSLLATLLLTFHDQSCSPSRYPCNLSARPPPPNPPIRLGYSFHLHLNFAFGPSATYPVAPRFLCPRLTGFLCSHYFTCLPVSFQPLLPLFTIWLRRKKQCDDSFAHLHRLLPASTNWVNIFRHKHDKGFHQPFTILRRSQRDMRYWPTHETLGWTRGSKTSAKGAMVKHRNPPFRLMN
jgi:hypothetical protein